MMHKFTVRVCCGKESRDAITFDSPMDIEVVTGWLSKVLLPSSTPQTIGADIVYALPKQDMASLVKEMRTLKKVVQGRRQKAFELGADTGVG